MEKAATTHDDKASAHIAACRAADAAHVTASPAHPLLWPLFAAATASEAAASYFNDIAQAYMSEAAPEAKADLAWTTPNRVVLDLATVRLRDFSEEAAGVPTLICAPFALHGATIADFAPGHSLVEALRNDGVRRLFVTDWRSASDDMRLLSIDNYLADLNVLVDALGAPIDLIGLCQGGWMALVFAARFRGKVRRLVLAGAPVDVRAGASAIATLAERTPLLTFRDLVRLGGGRVLGHQVLELWGPILEAEETVAVLQLAPDVEVSHVRALERRFREWYGWTVDLPGAYYLQVVSWLFQENRIAEGRFVALGRAVDLADVQIPVFLIAARDDNLVSADQLLATARLIGTPAHAVETVVEPCGHLSLFAGRETLDRAWGKVARWLLRDLTPGRPS